MNTTTTKKPVVYFTYTMAAMFPQIPYVQDVLYVLQLSDKKDERGYYSPAGNANFGEYIRNLMLAAFWATNTNEALSRYPDKWVRHLVAKAIIELCPPEAKCLFNPAFLIAFEELTDKPVRYDGKNRKSLLEACGCPQCELAREEMRVG